jgi:hypothetical protein
MPKSRSSELFDLATGYASLHLKTPGSRGADLAFVRPNDHHSTHNPITMNCLALCPHNVDFLGLVRPSPVWNPHSLSLSHNLQPTSPTVPARCIIGIITAHLPAKCL